MISIPFRLIPYAGGGPGSDPPSPCLSDSLSITGRLSISAKTLEVAYQLQGDLDQLSLPSPDSSPERRNLLWQSTCLELFLARRGAHGYWEFNLSPAGHWNVYRLEGYRQGLTPEPAYQQLPFHVEQHGPSPTKQLTLTLRCPLPPDIQSGQGETAAETICEAVVATEVNAAGCSGLEVAITAVIQRLDGTLSYWALNHPAAQADFHDRGGFTIQVP